MSRFTKDDLSVGRASGHFDALIMAARNEGAFATGNPLLTLIAKEIDEIAMRKRMHMKGRPS